MSNKRGTNEIPHHTITHHWTPAETMQSCRQSLEHQREINWESMKFHDLHCVFIENQWESLFFIEFPLKMNGNRWFPLNFHWKCMKNHESPWVSIEHVWKFIDLYAKMEDFHDFPDFPASAGKYCVHPPKFCAGLGRTFYRGPACAFASIALVFALGLRRGCARSGK